MIRTRSVLVDFKTTRPADCERLARIVISPLSRSTSSHESPSSSPRRWAKAGSRVRARGQRNNLTAKRRLSFSASSTDSAPVQSPNNYASIGRRFSRTFDSRPNDGPRKSSSAGRRNRRCRLHASITCFVAEWSLRRRLAPAAYLLRRSRWRCVPACWDSIESTRKTTSWTNYCRRSMATTTSETRYGAFSAGNCRLG